MTTSPDLEAGGAPALPAHVRVAIIGAGFSGLCMAIRLKREGIEDFVVLERADEVGGTWRDNTYPGCKCDIPSALYSYSFAPNPEWSRAYPLQSEIKGYLQRCAHDFGVMDHVRFNHALVGADWNEQEWHWRIETSQGPISADVMVGATGGLSEPSSPDIAGLDSFEGTVFHSATWNHDHDLTGERVAVIGTGASAIQFVPEIQPQVGQMHVFQRTPSWVMADPDRPFTEHERKLFRRVPFTQRLLRMAIYFAFEATVFGTIVNRRLSKGLESMARRNLYKHVKDPELRAKLEPDYTIGCKRITMSNTYYPALLQPNVELVTDPIHEVRKRSIVTADGTEREVDTVILGTGFKVHDNPGFSRIRGRDGISLGEAWEGSPRAYLGTAIAGFPNFFLMVGPNSAGGYNSIIFTTEAHVNYAINALRQMDKRGLRAVEVRPEVYEKFNRKADKRLRASVWNEGGCSSWYLDPNGRNAIWWPGFTMRLWQRTRRFQLADYVPTG